MKRFVEGEDRTQVTLLPERLDDYVAADNPVRVIDVFVDELDLHELGFVRAEPASTGRKLDFLSQEMNREVNTMGSKADGLRVSELIIAAKAELEKMREQVQNVE